MSLLTYQDARPWARAIKDRVVRRMMPPWHIDRNIGITKFKDDPSLSDAEVATISNWVDQGALEGNPADMPPPRQFSDTDRWHIGTPDFVVSMAKPYKLKAQGGDEYYDIDLHPGFKEDMYLSAVPKDWGQQELVWTLTAHGRTEKAYAQLIPEEEILERLIQTRAEI